jgi:hypothetical protein
MDRDILLLLIGAGIGLVGGAAGAVIQHFLSLREDRIKRERDREKEEQARKEEYGRISVPVRSNLSDLLGVKLSDWARELEVAKVEGNEEEDSTLGDALKLLVLRAELPDWARESEVAKVEGNEEEDSTLGDAPLLGVLGGEWPEEPD